MWSWPASSMTSKPRSRSSGSSAWLWRVRAVPPTSSRTRHSGSQSWVPCQRIFGPGRCRQGCSVVAGGPLAEHQVAQVVVAGFVREACLDQGGAGAFFEAQPVVEVCQEGEASYQQSAGAVAERGEESRPGPPCRSSLPGRSRRGRPRRRLRAGPRPPSGSGTRCSQGPATRRRRPARPRSRRRPGAACSAPPGTSRPAPSPGPRTRRGSGPGRRCRRRPAGRPRRTTRCSRHSSRSMPSRPPAVPIVPTSPHPNPDPRSGRLQSRCRRIRQKQSPASIAARAT